jgi:hypothetical protein
LIILADIQPLAVPVVLCGHPDDEKVEGEGADLALNRPAAGAYLSDELPYSSDRYRCYCAYRDFICDAFQMAYRLIVDRGTPARPLDRKIEFCSQPDGKIVCQ